MCLSLVCGTEQEWIELCNDSDQIIDISDWQIDDEEGGSKPFIFPKNTLIAPESYLVFPRKTTGIALNNDKDRIRLLLSSGVVFQEISYEEAPQGQSSARTPEGFVWSMPTPGLSNITGINNKEFGYNESLQSETTKYLSQETTLNLKENPKNSIKGGWTYLPQDEKQETAQINQEQNLIANLEEISEKSNSKLILIIIIIVAVFIAIMGVLKLKKKI